MSNIKKVSLKTIAEHVGVSPSTVSIVLNNHGKELRIAQETQNKIKNAAKELGYYGDCAKKHPVSENNTYKICVFFTNTLQDFPFERFNSGISQFNEELEYDIDLVYHPFTPNQLNHWRILFSPRYYDGIIVTSPYDQDIEFLKNCQFHVPVVLYNCQINGYTSICHNDYDVGKQAAEIFLKHQKQHIAIVTPKVRNKGISLRIAGFTDYLTNCGFLPENLRVTNGSSKNAAGGYEATSKLLQNSFIPSAIYVVNDLMSGGVLNCLHKHSLQVPRDTEILSYGNIGAPFLIPGISSFATNAEKMAYTCMKSVFAEIWGQAQPGLYYSFDTECIWRESCPK